MTLAALLEAKRSHLGMLTALLQQEQELLVQSRPDGALLTQLAAEKAQLFATFERLELLRREAQQELGFDNTSTAAEHAAAHAGCLPLWRSIQATARQAAHLNGLNGLLVRQGLEHNQRALNTLQEMAGSVVYDSNGKPCTIRNSINSTV